MNYMIPVRYKKVFGIGFLFLFVLFITIIPTFSFQGRPSWLLSANEISKGWLFDSENSFSDRYFFSILSPSKSIFTIETLEFPNASDAKIYIENEYNEWTKEGQLDYVFPNEKLNLSIVDTGIAWEVKSSCCYSRGALYSLDYIYIYIFGSQTSTWEEVKIIYTYQTIKILEYLDRSVPEGLLDDLNKTESNDINGFTLSILIPILLILVLDSKKKRK